MISCIQNQFKENYCLLVLNKKAKKIEFYKNHDLITSIDADDEFAYRAVISDNINEIYYLHKIDEICLIIAYNVELNNYRTLYSTDKPVSEFCIQGNYVYLLQKSNNAVDANTLIKIDTDKNIFKLLYSVDDNKKYLSNLLVCGNYICTILYDSVVPEELIIMDQKEGVIKKRESNVAKIFNSKNADLIIVEYCEINKTEFSTSVLYEGNIGYLNIKTFDYIPLNQKYERRVEPVALNKQFLLIPTEVNYLWSIIKNPLFGAEDVDIEYFIWDNQKKKNVDKIFKTNTSESVLLDAVKL